MTDVDSTDIDELDEVTALVPYNIAYEQASFLPDEIDEICFTYLPLSLARRVHAVPFEIIEREGRRTIRIAVLDPLNLEVQDDIMLAVSGSVEPVILSAPAALIEAGLVRWEQLVARQDQARLVSELEQEQGIFIPEEEEEASGRVAELVKEILDAAVVDGASDVHFEARPVGLQIRFRIDGVLSDYNLLEPRFVRAIINRLKVQARVDSANHRKFQDGRFRHQSDAGQEIDCRVSIMPTADEFESVVVRIFDQNRSRMDLKDVGFNAGTYEHFARLLDTSPHGLILTTGPTGAGKTTTLHAALDRIASVGRKALTIEDPVEIRTARAIQVQVDPPNITFPLALKAFLRADPDIMLVGEIRDGETAQLAVEAALTGHLVLSTMHANDAAAAPARLLELGVEPYLLVSCLKAVITQRLARRLCFECRHQTPLTPELAEEAAWPDTVERPTDVFAPVGCGACRKTGYRGRIAVGEIFEMNEELSELISARRPMQDLARAAQAGGMRTMREEAFQKVAEGMTSLEELRRQGF